MAKTYGRLWMQITSFENLYLAFMDARKKKTEKPEVMRFQTRLEENLITMQNELLWKTWEPKPWRIFEVYEPKKRTVHAPAFCDRVIHHALVRVINPLFDRKMIDQSFACRMNRGTHRAVALAQRYAQEVQCRDGGFYFLKCDVHHYFPSIDHDVLRRVIRQTISDCDALWLMDHILDASGFPGVGLPIGALTSQLFANIYLNELDHFVKDELGVKRYLRYMDDFLVFSSDKAPLRQILAEISSFLQTELRLSLNQKTRICSGHEAIDFCGYRIWTTHILPRKRNLRRVRKRLRRMARLYSHGQMTLDRIIPVIASHLGYLKHCRDGRGTEKFFQELVFRRSEMIIKNVKRRKTHERLRRTAASGTGTGTDSGASH